MYSQVGGGTYEIHIQRSVDEIALDGKLEERSWNVAERVGDFYQNFPYDTSYAKTRTEVMATYDDDYLYIAGVCYDDLEGDFVVQSLKRDFDYLRSDVFIVFIDPFMDKTNGFSFGVSPLGVQLDGLITSGGNFGVTTSWDNKWFSSVEREEGRWVVEMAIPFKTLRFNPELDTWGINFARNDLKRNESSAWTRVPRGYLASSMAFNGKMVWDQHPKKTGANISLIPYGRGGVSVDYEQDSIRFPFDAGIDAKIAVSSALNLDVTIKPDFSQVEVDRQVTNLERFSIFFPERRTFFLENSDLFSRAGFSRIRPFFSRNIGLYQGRQVPILGGARLSGKLNPRLRIGAMNMQTLNHQFVDLETDVDSLGNRFTYRDTTRLNAQNYTVLTARQQVFKRSTLGLIFVNRQGFEGNRFNKNDYNRVFGLDFNLLTKNDNWRGIFFYHHSLDPNTRKDKGATGLWLRYVDSKWIVDYNHEYVGENYNAEVGFVWRKGIIRFEPRAERRFFTKGNRINFHGPILYANIYLDKQWNSLDQNLQAAYRIRFQNTANFRVFGSRFFTRLLSPFDVTGTGQEAHPDSSYVYNNFGVEYNSDYRKKLTYGASVNYGKYYLGNKLTYAASIGFRWQPIGNFSLDFERNEIRFGEGLPFQSTSLMLIGPKLEFSFTRSLFFSTFIQYNTQIDNVNINARLQWRFKPMSDLFIVYTDNYDSGNIRIKNRALVVKLTYWFTL